MKVIIEAHPTVDHAKIASFTEDDLRRHRDRDGGMPPGEPRDYRLVTLAARVRQAMRLSQPDFAELIGIPVGTIRNWEQGRVKPDPAARSLLLILLYEPKAALRALRRVPAA